MAETDVKRVRDFWNERAALGVNAGSNDVVAKKIEIQAIASYVKDGMKILDFGCGSGVTAIELAHRYKVDILGVDYAENMVAEGNRLAADATLKGSLRFITGDVGSLSTLPKDFDLIYTERVIINLNSWELQRDAIASLTNLLAPGGRYVMCENSVEGLQAINALRVDAGLDSIAPPWHNKYLTDAEVEGVDIPGVRLEDINYYSSTYYFLSRVVNAWLAARGGESPSYDAPVNQLALALPSLGTLGQGRIWVWRKEAGEGA